MNRPLKGVFMVLLIALICFGALSFRPDGIDIFGLHLNTASFAEDLLGTTTANATNPIQQQNRKAHAITNNRVKPSEPHYKPGEMPLDTAKKVILFIGDSMLEGLGPRMAAYAKHNGHTLINVIWYSSTTEVWGTSTRLQERIQEFKPNYIIVSLGANELFVADIKKKRQKYVNEMLRQIGNLPYVWIGPPNWKPDTGINDMLQASCQPGSFFLSNGQHFDRAKDGAHPTRTSAAAWADRVCHWIMTQSAHPIVLNKPTETKARCRTIVYQPKR